MTRTERQKVLEETKDAVKEITRLTLSNMAECVSMDDEETLLSIKMLNLSNKLMDYAESQAQQLDKIEDRLDQLYDLVKRNEK